MGVPFEKACSPFPSSKRQKTRGPNSLGPATPAEQVNWPPAGHKPSQMLAGQAAGEGQPEETSDAGNFCERQAQLIISRLSGLAQLDEALEGASKEDKSLYI